MKSIAPVVLIDVIVLAAAGMIETWSPISLGWIWAGLAVFAVVLLLFWKNVSYVFRKFTLARQTTNSRKKQMENTLNNESERSGTENTTVEASLSPLPVESTDLRGGKDSSPDRVYTPRSVMDIFGSIHEATNLEANNITRPYIGKWLKIKGAVGDVFGFDSRVILSVNPPDIKEKYYGTKHVSLNFERDRWLVHIETIKKGDFVEAVGQIDEVDRWQITLENCELIEVKSK